MIDEIRVENLALIREASLVPCSGLTVLTGETGAGKTALPSLKGCCDSTVPLWTMSLPVLSLQRSC